MKKSDIEYTFNTIVDTLGLSRDVPLSYGFSSSGVKNNIMILCEDDELDTNICSTKHEDSFDNLFLSNGVPVVGLSTVLNRGKPLIEYDGGGTAVSLDEENNVIYIGFDLLQSIFHFLTLKHEKGIHKDGLGRPRGGSCKVDPCTPVVNRYLKLLLDCFVLLYKRMEKPLFQKWYWPEGHDFAVCLTHDIDWNRPDNLYPFYLPMVVLYKRWFGRFFKSLKTGASVLFTRHNPWGVDQIVKMEERYGVNSTFYYLISSRKTRLTRYRISQLKNEMRMLQTRGFDVQYHGPSANKKRIAREMMAMGKIIKDVEGVRQHFLRTGTRVARLYQELGFKHDSSYGYPDGLGYRASLSFPYPLYDKKTHGPGMLEIPPCIMDRSLDKHMNKSAREAFVEVLSFLASIEEDHGLATIIWHNSSFDPVIYPGWSELYEKMLKRLKRDKAWTATAKDICEWWSIREQTSVEDIMEGKGDSRLSILVYNAEYLHDIKDAGMSVEEKENYECLDGAACKLGMVK